MFHTISDEAAAKAKHPHELFLINLIFNHVFLFIATISASSLQALAWVVPVISLAIIGYTLWRARRPRPDDDHYVRCHWQLAARRSGKFVAMWALAAAGALALFAVANGEPAPVHYALGATLFLPIMLTMLVLILMESEALQHARSRTLPKALAGSMPATASA
jgi:predicted permease